MARSDEILSGDSSPREIPSRASRLGPGLSLQAELSGKEDLVLQGNFKGLIGLEGADLYVDLKAEVEAEVEAANVYVYGALTGNIQATGRVFLAPTSRIKGNISAAQISIQEGAMFRGAIQMKPKGA
ncbi:MAG: polymer-forming cytoskeletal protein [Candidatus Aminicenantes bacterium]|nr:polymer-forming cytoskeletal protein [Candidatus Aminicenantes bacterium]